MSDAPRKINILVVKDKEEDFRIIKGRVADLPMRMIIIGKSDMSGKSNLLVNFLLRPYGKDDHDGQDFYYHDFRGDHIFLISPSAHTDDKLKQLAELKKIPPEHIITEYREDHLVAIEKYIEKEQLKAYDEGNAKHWLIILDDCSFGGNLRSHIHGTISKLFCNLRHFQVSVIMTSQKYTDILPTCRTNASAMILFELPERELEQFCNDSMGYSAKEIRAKFLKATAEKHGYMVYLPGKPRSERFLDRHWLPLP